MRYVIAPFSGWEENYTEYSEAVERAKEIISNNEENLVSEHGYKNPENLIDHVYDSLEEMYEEMNEE